jgi:iduronate 2-sulfatase
MDAQIGRILDELDALALTSETICVLHGDHGWQLGEHNSWHKYTNFELGGEPIAAMTFLSQSRP